MLVKFLVLGQLVVSVFPSEGALIGSYLGIPNTLPLSMVHLGNCTVAGAAPDIVFGKNTGWGSRNALMGYSDTFHFVIGDYGKINLQIL